MLNTNFNAYFVPHQLMYPYGYQYLIMPQQFSVQNQQQYYAQPQTQISENISSIEPNHSIEAIQHKTYSETESKPEQTSNQEEIKETNIQKRQKEQSLKKSQKPNYLVKSTNIQKLCKGNCIFCMSTKKSNLLDFGETGAQEFLKLMNRLRNKLRNIAHITRYTHQENFLQMFRILGYSLQQRLQQQLLRKDSVSYIYNSKIQQKSCHVANKAIVKNSVLKY